MKVDVIIPTKTTPAIAAMLLHAIKTLRDSEAYITFNVVLVESEPTVVDVGQDDTILYDRPTFNYNHALRQGLAQTSNEWVVLANNDLIFHPFWFTQIMNAHKAFPAIKSFSPWNSRNAYHDSIFSKEGGNILVGFRVCYELCGWCLVCKREVVDTIDLSDRVDLWYSDNIYSDEIIKHKFIHALIRHSVVDHICSQTIDFSQYDSRKDLLKYRGEA